jgi:hypothetical protein
METDRRDEPQATLKTSPTSAELYLRSYNVHYLFDKTPYWRPWVSWMSVEVHRMSADAIQRTQSPRLTFVPTRYSALRVGAGSDSLSRSLVRLLSLSILSRYPPRS